MNKPNPQRPNIEQPRTDPAENLPESDEHGKNKRMPPRQNPQQGPGQRNPEENHQPDDDSRTAEQDSRSGDKKRK